jgi:hypothetical protein
MNIFLIKMFPKTYFFRYNNGYVLEGYNRINSKKQDTRNLMLCLSEKDILETAPPIEVVDEVEAAGIGNRS